MHTRTHSYWRPRGNQYPLILFLRIGWHKILEMQRSCAHESSEILEHTALVCTTFWRLKETQNPGNTALVCTTFWRLKALESTALLRQNPGNYSIPGKHSILKATVLEYTALGCYSIPWKMQHLKATVLEHTALGCTQRLKILENTAFLSTGRLNILCSTKHCIYCALDGRCIQRARKPGKWAFCAWIQDPGKSNILGPRKGATSSKTQHLWFRNLNRCQDTTSSTFSPWRHTYHVHSSTLSPCRHQNICNIQCFSPWLGPWRHNSFVNSWCNEPVFLVPEAGAVGNTAMVTLFKPRVRWDRKGCLQSGYCLPSTCNTEITLHHSFWINLRKCNVNFTSKIVSELIM